MICIRCCIRRARCARTRLRTPAAPRALGRPARTGGGGAPAQPLALVLVLALPLALVLAPALGLAAPADAQTTLVGVRHGEKPAAGLGQLSCQGLNRALSLPDVLVSKFGPPDALYAPDPGVTAIDRGVPYNYIRPLATIEPTAIRLGMPVHTAWGLTGLSELGAELLSPSHQGQTLFVAWEHTLLVRLLRNLMAARGGDPLSVPDWDADDFDSIYIVRLPVAGPARFELDHEGLNGLSTQCPAPH